MSPQSELNDRETFERFKERHADLASARQIVAAFQEDDFVNHFAQEFTDGARQARRVYQTAVLINEQAALLWANILDIASPHWRQTRFNNIPKSFLDNLEQIPGFNRLFGELDFVECDHCRSILGPAAYFVDLMRFIETHITEAPGHTIGPENKLLTRRPDLAHIRLDCHNAHDLIPYLDLVNEVLEGVLQANGFSDPDRIAAEAQYPISLPFHRPLFQIRTYLEELKTNLQTIYKALGQHDSRLIQEQLALFPVDFHHLVGDLATPDQVSALLNVFPLALDGPDSLADLAIFREKTGLARAEINELLFQDLDQREIDAGLSRLFFINQTDDGLGPLDLVEAKTSGGRRYERLVNLSVHRLHRLHRFVKLARHLDWSFTELDWALRSLQGSYRPETALRFDGLTDYIACSSQTPLRLSRFTLEAWVRPESSGALQPILALRNRTDASQNMLFCIDAGGRLALHAGENSYSGHASLEAGHFSHVAITYDGQRLVLNLNGRIDALFPLSLPSVSAGELEIGRDGSDHYFTGIIKEVRIWDVARVVPEIGDWRFRRLTGLEANLAGYWPLVENDWNRLDDLSSGGREGILGGAEFVTQPTWVFRDLVLDPFPRLIAPEGYQFDGHTTYLAGEGVDYPALSAMTLELWLTLTEAKSCILVSQGNRYNGRTLFSLGLNADRRLRFHSTSGGSFGSVKAIPLNQPSHIAVVIEAGELTFYVDGQPEKAKRLKSGELASQGDDLSLGRRLTGEEYFNGEIRELRLWSHARAETEIKLNMHRQVARSNPDLLGYWRLDERHDVMDPYLTEQGLDVLAYSLANDLSFGANHLTLGDLPQIYQPARVDAGYLIPPTPVLTGGEVLQFDGDNDVVTLSNPADWGLGRYEKWRFTLWFRSDEPQRADAQVLLAQGDGEAGGALYLEDGQLYAAFWQAGYERTSVTEILLQAGPVRPGQWHHLTLTSDESQGLQPVVVTLYLDGHLAAVRRDGFRLSPVGPLHLGGLPAGADVRLNGRYLAQQELYRFFFRGQLADLRLATALVDPGETRWLSVPLTDADLAYCPLDEGQGQQITDRQLTNPYAGQLRQNNMVYGTAGSEDEAERLHTHYQAPEAMNWANYSYAGRFRLTAEDQAIGFTVLSQHPGQVDQCYVLRRTAGQPALHLVAHPFGIQPISGQLDSGVIPEPDIWYRFLIQVEDDGQKTHLRARIWPDETPEPTDFAIVAADDSHLRLLRGTVGVWARLSGDRSVDDLTVWPGDGPETETAERLLDENFEAYRPGEPAAGWGASRVRAIIQEDDSLFAIGGEDGDSALAISGAHSELQDLFTHYSQPFALDWGRYVYTGRFKIASENEAIGFTMLSRFPELDAYYRLSRDRIRPAFHLSAHPHGAHALTGTVDSDVVPQANAWHRFYIEVGESETATEIRAKIWAEETLEPAVFQIEAQDAGPNRLQAGTVGLWSLGPGSRVVDDLLVAAGRPLADNFQDAATLARWQAVQRVVTLEPSDGAFAVTRVEGNPAYGLDGPAGFLAHLGTIYDGPEAGTWANYAFSGRLYLADPDSILALIVYQTAGGQDGYRLGPTAGDPTWRLARLGDQAAPLGSASATDFTQATGEWTHFRLEVKTQKNQTSLRARLWPAGDAEPDSWQIEASDESDDRLTAGSVGIWSLAQGPDNHPCFVDDLAVRSLAGPTILLDEDFSSQPSGWRDSHYMPDELKHSENFTKGHFKILTFQGGKRFGTETELHPDDIQRDRMASHFHGIVYDAALARNWRNYAFTGEMYISEHDGGVGITFSGPDLTTSYRLWRDVHHSTFRVTGPEGRELDGRIDSGIEPNPGRSKKDNQWVAFRIEVRATGNRTHILARVWPAAESEPSGFQIDAFDDNPQRQRAGTVGLWTNGPGTKLFDNLRVTRLALLLDNFQAYRPGATPEDWRSLRSVATLAGDNDRIGLRIVEGHAALQLNGNADPNAEWHLYATAEGSQAWSDTLYTGLIHLATADTAVGLAVFSQYGLGEDACYLLRRDADRPAWHFAGYPDGVRRLREPGGPELLPEPGRWYRFKIWATALRDRTNLVAKIWLAGQPEPAGYQLSAYDDSGSRLPGGSVGLWTAGNGQVSLAGATVYQNILLDESFNGYAAGEQPDNWLDTRTEDMHTADDALFTVSDIGHNLARWRQIDDYPILQRPLDTRALRFSGRQHMALATTQDLETLDNFTLAFWLTPPPAEAPLLSLACQTAAGHQAKLLISFSRVRAFLLQLAYEEPGVAGDVIYSVDSDPLPAADGAHHVALVVNADGLGLWVDGQETANISFSFGLPLTITGIQFGDNNVVSPEWLLHEALLWSGDRSDSLAVDQRYQQPLVADVDLLGYWPLVETAGVLVQDQTSPANQWRLGGHERARQPSLVSQPVVPSHWPATNLSTALACTKAAGALSLTLSGAPATLPRRTVEIWFRVDDVFERRPQLLYHEGDEDQGLAIYIENGRIFYGGYNRHETHPTQDAPLWPGTWMSTDRLNSGKWHHAALVLDGRRQMRPGALRAFLDGRPVDAGDGCQLRPSGSAAWTVHLAAAPGIPTPVHPAVPPAGDVETHFAGQILDVRFWQTARTQAELAATYRQQITGQEPYLVGWWQFAPGDSFPDLSGHGPDLPASEAKLLSIDPEPMPALPASKLDESTLEQLVTLKILRERHSLSLERLCALWYQVKHFGRADQKTLFDRLFNAAPADPDWPIYWDAPPRWDVTGESEPKSEHQGLRTRLMASLGLNSTDLDLLVRHLKGQQPVVELNHTLRRQLFQLASLAKTLRLSIADLLALLKMMDLTQIDMLDAFRRLSDRVHWMETVGVDVAELRFLLHDEDDGRFRRYDEKNIRTQAEALLVQPAEQDQGPAGNDQAAAEDNQAAAEDNQAAAPPAKEIALRGILAELTGADEALVQVVQAYLVPQAPLQQVWDWFRQAAVPEQSLPDDLWSYLARANKLLYLAVEFALTPADLSALLADPAIFEIDDMGQLGLDDLRQLDAYRRLKGTWPERHDALLQLLQMPTGDQEVHVTALCEMADWDRDQAAGLIAFLALTPPLNRPESLLRLVTCFELAKKLGVDVSFLMQLTAGPDNYTFYDEQAGTLRQVLQARHDEKSWPAAYKPLHGRIAAGRRDALLRLAMLTIPDSFAGRHSPDVLSDYYLLDLLTGPEMDTSRLFQAIASLQLYVQRWLNNLEPGDLARPIPVKEWEWMKNYRVWEANRKVFLWPENYIEPELRDTKTPFFEELEQDLQQTEINSEAADRVFSTYLNKFAEVARLQIVGAYFHKAEGDGEDDILFLVGRTRSEPHTFFHRRLRYPKGDEAAATWEPWRKIDLSIPATWVTPVYAFGRIFLFWPELLERSETEGKGERAVSRPAYQSTVKYTYYDFNDMWQPAQTLWQRNELLSKAESYKPEFQRVYVQRARNFSPNPPIPGSDKQSLELDNVVHLERSLPYMFNGEFTLGTWFRLGELNDGLLGENNQQTTTLLRVKFSNWSPYYFSGNVTELSIDATNNNVENPAYTAANHMVAGLNHYRAPLNALISALPTIVDEKADWEKHKKNVQDHMNGLANASADLVRRADQAGDAGAAASKTAGLSGSDAINKALGAARRLIALIDQKKTGDQAALTAIADEATEAQGEYGPAVAAATESRNDMPPYKVASYTVNVRWGTPAIILTSHTITDDEWHHLALVVDRYPFGNFSTYLDGAQKKSKGNLWSHTQFSGTVWLRFHWGIWGNLLIEDPFVFSSLTAAPIYTARLSEFAFTQGSYNQAQVSTLKNQPQSVSAAGGLYLPLDEPIKGAILRLVDGGPVLEPPAINQDWWQAEQARIQTKRERLIVVYGDQTLTMRGTGLDRSFELLRLPLGQEEQGLFYDLNLSVDRVHVAITSGPSLNDYAAATGDSQDIISTVRHYDPEAIQYYLDHPEGQSALSPADRQALVSRLDVYQQTVDSYANTHYLITHQAKYEVTLFDVHNQPGWYILDTGDAQFLLQAVTDDGLLPLPTATDLLALRFRQPKLEKDKVQIYYWFDPKQAGKLRANTSTSSPPFKFRFVRLDTFAVGEMSTRLFTGGADRLLHLESQMLAEANFAANQVHSSLVDLPATTLDFDGASGIYFWEIFFHIPFLIANQLNARQKFEEAQHWYHHIFNPTMQEGNGTSIERYWRFLPFRHDKAITLGQLLKDKSALAAYRADPFDPHAIARLRQTAYLKAVVMKYIDNLLDWGDQLFAQDTRESINEAVSLYVFAYNLLGPRPEGRRVRDSREVGDYEAVRQVHQGGIPDFLAQLETAVTPTDPSTAQITPFSHIVTDFGLVENEYFLGYWDRVEDRLYKIRHSLNIQGIFRTLALFQPPIDPRALVAAIAGGLSIGDALAAAGAPAPHYRYGYMLERAKEVSSFVIDLGGELLAAMESRDAEKLAELQNRHEQKLLDMMTDIKKHEKEAAAKSIEAMDITKQSLNHQIDKLAGKIAEYMSPLESASMALDIANKILTPIKGALETSSWIVKVIPSVRTGASGIASPVAVVEIGPNQVSAAVKAAQVIVETSAEVTALAARLTGKFGEYERRKGAWQLEKKILEYDLGELEKQIEIAGLQLQIAERELQIHETTIRQAKEIASFYRTKFTNQELYNWMVSRLSALYFQAYKLAHEVAKAAEKGMQYELPTDETYISFGYWDGLRKGLLAGQSLMFDLLRMEKSHLDQDSRFLEIEKTISMKRTFPAAMFDLLQNGACEFELSELLFNQDFPGHYCRLIKTISLSVKADIAPYDGVKATLSQLSGKTVLQPDINAVRHLMGDDTVDEPDNSVIRSNWRANQQIAISRPEGDHGMFVLNFFLDDRYFPFEGTGAISRWRLEMPPETNTFMASFTPFDDNQDHDVIIHLRYTAKTEGGDFKQNVMDDIK